MKGDTYVMDVTLQNPLPSTVILNRIDVLHGSSKLTCINARDIRIPALSTIVTRVYLIPESIGDLTLSGIRVHIDFNIFIIGSFI